MVIRLLSSSIALISLGLFEYSHMNYEVDRAHDVAGEPSLAEMTEKAISILSKNPRGYFLLVEGRRTKEDYFTDVSLLLGIRPLVKFIRNYIWHRSRVFS